MEWNLAIHTNLQYYDARVSVVAYKPRDRKMEGLNINIAMCFTKDSDITERPK